ncbi:MAG: glycerophosphoryl diester phosphodiesterase [Paraglaciecola sp.]|jgi:glycerophosphoryl diester phosphodiesterase
MLIFAHRGASADAPENTLQAIDKALFQQADGIEIDVHQHQGELLVIHDHWLHRTTTGQGQLHDYTLAQLQQLDAGNGQTIPTLWQVMTRIAGKCRINIELKGQHDVALVLGLIDNAQFTLGFTPEQFIVSSFDHHLLWHIKQRQPALQIGALTASKPLAYAAFAAELGAYSVNVDITSLDNNFVQDAKRRGVKVFVYTVDEPRDLLKLQTWQVDGVFCNAPGKARQILEDNS